MYFIVVAMACMHVYMYYIALCYTVQGVLYILFPYFMQDMLAHAIDNAISYL